MKKDVKKIIDLLEDGLEERKETDDRRQMNIPWEPSLDRRTGRDRRKDKIKANK